jgi:uncharacterized membrane protein
MLKVKAILLVVLFAVVISLTITASCGVFNSPTQDSNLYTTMSFKDTVYTTLMVVGMMFIVVCYISSRRIPVHS